MVEKKSVDDAIKALEEDFEDMDNGLHCDSCDDNHDDQSTTPTLAILEEPPVPEREPGGKRYTAVHQRERLAGTVPVHLLEKFENERQQRGKNVSQQLEFVLWNYFRLINSTSPQPTADLRKESPKKELQSLKDGQQEAEHIIRSAIEHMQFTFGEDSPIVRSLRWALDVLEEETHLSFQEWIDEPQGW